MPDFMQLCRDKIDALTTRDGAYPADTRTWEAGSPQAADELQDMFAVFARDADAAREQRIWPAQDALALLVYLCRRVCQCEIYPQLTPGYAKTLARHQRAHRLFHDRDSEGRSFLSCVIHGRLHMVSQSEAERRHALGEPCPTCTTNIATKGYRS